MKKIILLSIYLVFLISNISAAATDISGQWLITKVVFGENSEELYQTLTFRTDGMAELQDMVFGSWEMNGNNKVKIKSEMVEEFEGTWIISKLSDSELILKSNNNVLYFKNYNETQIEQENSESDLQGVWELTKTNEDDSDIYVYFEYPNIMQLKYIDYGYTSNESGLWIYNKNNNSVTMMVRDPLLRGNSKILSITDSEISLMNNGNKISANKLEQNGTGREQFSLSNEEYSSETDTMDYNNNYLEYENFSWAQAETKTAYLERVTNLKYKKSFLLNNFDVFITDELSAKVSRDEYSGSIAIDNIFEELPKGDYPDENIFYPLEEPFIYTLVGDKEVTVPAGTFECIVIDTDDYSMNSITRLYMIKNRPGVYAKIINIEDQFDEELYTMYELTDIEGDFNNQKNEKISGEWFLIEMESNGEINKMSTNFEFIDDGRISITQSGYISYYNWSFNEDDNSIILNLNNGDQELIIEVLTDSKMQLKNNELSYSFIKMNKGLAELSEEESRISGYWMLTNTSNPYSLIHLTDDHSVCDIERILRSPIDENYSSIQGKWMYNNTDKSLVFNTDEYEAICSGSFEINKLNETVMILGDRGNSLNFIKIDPDKIAKDNEESGISGLWKINYSTGTYNYYDFRDPILFRKGSSPEDMPISGLWFYNPENKMIFMGYQMHQLEGFTGITEITEETIIFGNGLVAERVR